MSATCQRCFEHLDNFDFSNVRAEHVVLCHKNIRYSFYFLPEHQVLQKVQIHRCLELCGTFFVIYVY